jgi:glycoside/pentoside/hexuronide:cation symporter, GPH family
MDNTAKQNPGWPLTIVYGVGALGSAAKTTPMTTLLMLYYNQVVGLSPLTVSTILMLSLVLDAVWDPLTGQLSDHFRSRWGRRLPFMYLSIVPTTILFVMIWTPPIYSSHATIAAYLAVCLIGIRLFDTLFELPHAAAVPEITSDYDFRTRLFTVRYLFEAFGGITVTALAYNVFMKENPDGTGGLLARHGYPPFALFTAAIIFIAMLTCTIGLHRRLANSQNRSARPGSLRAHGREMIQTLSSRSFLILGSSAAVISIGSGISSALSIYWLIYFYGFTQAQMTVLFLPIMAGMALTAAAPGLSKRFGKRNAAILLIWLSTIAGSVPLVLRLAEILPASSTALLVLVGVQSVIAAASMTMVLITIASMMADLVEETELRTGRRAEGLLLAANSFFRKATQGLGTLGAGALLTIVAFPDQAERTGVPVHVLDRLGWTYLATSFALTAITTAVLRFYRGDRTKHVANLKALRERGV